MLSDTGSSEEGVQPGSSHTGSEQMESPEEEGSSGYGGRDLENRSVIGRVYAKRLVGIKSLESFAYCERQSVRD